MLDRRQAETWSEYMERADGYHADFASGRISAGLYRAHLHGLGFRGREIEEEVTRNWSKDSRT